MPHIVPQERAAAHDSTSTIHTSEDPDARVSQLAHYELTVHTAALGDTSAQVAVQLCGSGGEAIGPLRLGGEGGAELLGAATRSRTLRPKTASAAAGDRSWPFRQAGAAVFEFDAPHVGSLKHLRVGHNGGGNSPAWHLDRVELRVTPAPAGDR